MDKTVITLRISKSMKARLQQAADEKGGNLSAEILHRLADHESMRNTKGNGMTDSSPYDERYHEIMRLARERDYASVNKDGICRCQSPRMKGWPTVSKDDWCGGHELAEGDETIVEACFSCRFFSQHRTEERMTSEEALEIMSRSPDGSEAALVDWPAVDRDADD